MNTFEEPKPDSACKRFWLKTYNPKATVNQTIILYAAIGVIFIVLGGVVLGVNNTIKEATARYDTQCTTIGTKCNIKINVPEDMNKPVYVFYELHNFYQNHRRFIKSKSASQLAGKVVTMADAQKFCDPIVTNKDMEVTLSIGNTTLDPAAIASPCGLIAKSVFNDTFVLKNPAAIVVPISDKGIAWPGDIGFKFKKQSDASTLSWADVENERFAVWMRTSGLPDFKKIWGKIDQDLKAGDYTVEIDNCIFNSNSVYNVKVFDGEKHFVLSTAGPFGGKNLFLAVAYIVVGCICLVISGIFCWKKKTSGDNFGELRKAD